MADVEQDRIAEADSVDLIVALDILEHLEADRAVVERVARCLKPGGLFVINVPAHPWLFTSHDTHLGHLRRYRPGEINALVTDSGLGIVHSTPLFMSTLVLLLMWRLLLQPLLGIRTDQSDVGMSFPWLVDRAMYAVSRLEGVVSRIQLPFGSSHLVLARRPAAEPDP